MMQPNWGHMTIIEGSRSVCAFVVCSLRSDRFLRCSYVSIQSNPINGSPDNGSIFSINSIYLIVLSTASLLSIALFRALCQVVCSKQVRNSRMTLRTLCRSQARIYNDSFMLSQILLYLFGDNVVLSKAVTL